MRLVLCLSPNPRFPLHTSRAKLCGNWAEYSSVASLCSVNLSPPLPVRSFVRSLFRSAPSPIPFRIAPTPNPNVILHWILQRGGSEWNCKVCHWFRMNDIASWVIAKQELDNDVENCLPTFSESAVCKMWHQGGEDKLLVQGDLFGHGTLFVDIKLKVLPQYKLLILKCNS